MGCWVIRGLQERSQVMKLLSVVNYNEVSIQAPTHILTKLLSFKEIYFSGFQAKSTYDLQGKNILSDFSTAIFYARRKQSNILKMLEGRKHEPRILYTVKLTYKHKRCRVINVNM